MVSTIRQFPFTNIYLDDILISSKENFEENKQIVERIISTLDRKNFAVKWPICKFFYKTNRMARFYNIEDRSNHLGR